MPKHGKGIVIEMVAGRRFEKEVKTKLRYPSQMGGYINQTYNSEAAAKLARDNLSDWAKRRAKIWPAH